MATKQTKQMGPDTGDPDHTVDPDDPTEAARNETSADRQRTGEKGYSGRGAILPVDERDGVLDELQAWFLTKAERDGWVYTTVLRQLVNSLYRDRDYCSGAPAEGARPPMTTPSSAT